MYPSRHEFVQLAKHLAPRLGYPGNISENFLSKPGSGLCYGLCCVIVEELLSGKMSLLEKQLIHLKELIEKELILEADNFDKLPEATQDSICTLFKNILIHHCSDKFLAIQNPAHKTYKVQDLAETTHTTHPEDLGLHQVAAFCGVYNIAEDDLANYLRVLKKACPLLPRNIPFALFLCNGNDATLLGYDPTHPTEPWFFCDFEGSPINSSPSETTILTRAQFDDIESLAPALNFGLSRKSGTVTEYIISSKFWCLENDAAAIKAFSDLFLSHQIKNRKLTIDNSHDVPDPYGKTCFDTAAGIGDIEAIQWFIEQKIDVNYRNLENGCSPLMCASQRGKIDVVILLLQHKADINLINPENGYTALTYAVEKNHIEIADLLLKNYANIDECNAEGNSALMLAAYRGFTEILNLLLQYHANINLRNPKNGFSALMFAAQEGHIDAVNLLLQYKSDLNFSSIEWRYTALMLATENGHTEVVNLLLQYKPDLDMRNRYDQSALILAFRHGYTEIALRLIEAGFPISSAYIEEKLVSLLDQHSDRLLLPILDDFCKTNYFYYRKQEPLKEIFQRHFDDLLSKNALAEKEKVIFIKLYIVLRDDKERQIHSCRATVTGPMAFFRAEYAQAKKELTAVFKPQCTYYEKRKAALQLLEAVECKEAVSPQHLAFEESVLQTVVVRCFPHTEVKASPRFLR